MWRGGRHGWCNGAIFMTAQVVVRLSDILLAVSAVVRLFDMVCLSMSLLLVSSFAQLSG